MKWIQLVLFLGMSSILGAQTMDYDLVFEKANKAYESKAYEEAIRLYEEILDAHDPKLYYNLANAYYRQQEYSKAVLYYEKAAKWGGKYEDIEYNLSLARGYLKDNYKIQRNPLELRFWLRISKWLSANTWAIFGLIGLILSVILLLISGRYPVHRFVMYTAVGLLGISILAYALSFTKHRLETHSSYGILMQASIAVKSEPTSSSKDLFILHEGFKVHLLDQHEEWQEIALPDGKKGWIPTKSVDLI